MNCQKPLSSISTARFWTRWITTGDIDGPLPGMRIGAVLHPAVLLAFANGASFLEHVKRPSEHRLYPVLRGYVYEPQTLAVSDAVEAAFGFAKNAGRIAC